MMIVLAVNVGSSSLKLSVYKMDNAARKVSPAPGATGKQTAAEQVLAHGRVERLGEAVSPLYLSAVGETRHSEIRNADHQSAIAAMISLLTGGRTRILESLHAVDAVGFKAVHAGEHPGTCFVDEKLISRMQQYSDAAPSHNPAYIRAMRAFSELVPGKPLVAVFETAFHSTIPDYAYTYSGPYEWYEKYGIRRYGFHGASLRYVSERTAQLLGHPGVQQKDLRLIACHLGGSSSICAMRGGRSIDTSMGFTPQAGVPMNNRSGDIDPFILPFILEREKPTTQELVRQLTENAGLKGISGLSSDMRDLEEAARLGHRRAELALNVFAYSVKKYIGSYAAALGGLDVLTFSGGIGEGSPEIRKRICEGLGFLGVAIDSQRNESCPGGDIGERMISMSGSPVPVYIIPTDEEIVVARETVRVLQGANR